MRGSDAATPMKMSAEYGRSIIVCLNPKCPLSQKRYLRGLKLSDHSEQCRGHIFGIEALLEAEEGGEGYPVDELGKAVKWKLERCREFNVDSYADVLIEDFRSTMNKVLDDFRQTMRKVMPGEQLYSQYKRIFSLDAVKEIIKERGTSAQLTTCLLASHSSQNYRELAETNSRLDELNTQLNSLMEDATTVLLGYQKDAIVVRRDLVQKKNPVPIATGKLNEVCYGLLKSLYIRSQFISVDHNWIRFPEADPNHFKPWVYAQKGFSEGVHKLIIQSSPPQKSQNVGVCILQHQDINSYPYAIYKSLHDRVTRQFKLMKGCELSTFLDSSTQVQLTMDLNHLKATLRDDQDRCLYMAALKSSVQYHFGLVGELWSVRILHLT